MREILFRAKRIDTGEWVEGNFYESKISGCYILVPRIQFRKDGGILGDTFDLYEIDPETICQYTGLKDKRGEKVFIGDIIRCARGCLHEVIWLKEYGGTYLGGMPAIYLSGLRDGYAWTGEEEIVENIFDDPELLKN